MFDFGAPNNKDGKLYRYDAKSSKVEVIADGLQIPNGIGFSPDNKVMYFIDSLTHFIFKFDYDVATGELSNRREFIRVDPGEPDGMTTSKDGHLWVAVWGQSSVLRYSPEGELVEVYKFPAERTSCPTFAGPNFDELIVTTASLVHADEEETEEKKNKINGTNGYAKDFGGTIFRVKVDVSGIPSNIVSI
ncbi:hypothetical protein AWJ20_157 [Sugiyamaella lignohabitans]|uniref:SMP-30/Gluconolactonase/LRE-like region domain-containing protein n=1 Tax=Sugiyamaella lignohabitans TaxID=796027 RepID=A0A167CNQ2_9ASCO|nr:uncharacterized protein AWJ20_157 [Sugiyamaella lignohabitans]ANB11930.1 hypothetical protein AWJ20_157 [Sugiyamaella lignohabitans]